MAQVEHESYYGADEAALEKKLKLEKFDATVEDRLKEKLAKGAEYISNVVVCPVSKCGSWVETRVEEDGIHLICHTCGWTKFIKKNEDDLKV